MFLFSCGPIFFLMFVPVNDLAICQQNVCKKSRLLDIFFNVLAALLNLCAYKWDLCIVYGRGINNRRNYLKLWLISILTKDFHQYLWDSRCILKLNKRIYYCVLTTMNIVTRVHLKTLKRILDMQKINIYET